MPTVMMKLPTKRGISNTLYDSRKTKALSVEKLSKMQSELQNIAQKMKFSIKNFFSNCDQICRKLTTRLSQDFLLMNCLL